MIIAANVVHATGDVGGTLGRIRSLLAPGGVLVLQEITRRPRWLDLVFGITDGWWAFRDTALRPAHALLDVPAWQRALNEAGLDEAAAVHEHEDAIPGQSVFVARAPATVPARSAAGVWLLLADRLGVGERVAAALLRLGRSCVVAFAGSDVFRKLDQAYEIPLGSPDAMRQLMEAVETEHGAVCGVMHLWSLDMPASTTDTTAASLLSSQSLGYGSMLDLLHGWLAAQHKDRKELTRVVLVTSEAQAIDEATAIPAVAQTPLWGFGRILLHEEPGLRPLLIDCSAQPDAHEAEAIAIEAIAEEREDEVALRGSRRFVRRLVRLDLDELPRAEAPREPAGGRPFSVEVGAPGSMDSLTLRELTLRQPGPEEVAIDVKAASLNFRDVVFAMGMLPPEAFENSLSAGAMGVDCAGIVTAVGEGVTDVRPGDEVMALSPASLASHALTKQIVVRKPAGLSFAEAAALPLAYVTAIYALERIARLRPGERILIHAATGGVGLAAIAVAQRAGAEIFATAGTETKRDYLRSRGIRYVMDSRSLDFAAQVMAATGGRGVDVVLNSLAGEAIAKGLSVLAPHGRFLEIGKADIYKNSDLPLDAFRRNLSFFGIQVDQVCDTNRDAVKDALRETLRGIEDGTLPPLPTQIFPLASLEDGLRTLAKARHVGKLVIEMDDPDIEIQPRVEDVPLFRPDATYLVTGGRGGVGTALAAWAVDHGARHLALVSRNASADEASDHLTRLRTQGVEVLLLDADVSVPGELTRAIDAADRPSSPLKGVFHGAMVIDDAPLSDLDSVRFARVMSPKVAGAWNLHLATRERALDHFVMFSSITSVYGNSRQGNYAAANAFLDALAGYRRAQGLPGLTLNWGVFSDVGYVSTREELVEYLGRQGQFGFSAEQGFAAMATVMKRGMVQATVSRTDWPAWAESNPVMGASPRFRALVQARASAETEKGSGRRSARVLETLLALEEIRRRPEVSQHLRQRVAKILGTAAERVEPTMPLPDMGMDSLMAVELMTMLKNDLAIDMPAVKLLQGMTVDQLTDKILEHLHSLGGSNPNSVADAASVSAAAPMATAAPSTPIAAIEPLSPIDAEAAVRSPLRDDTGPSTAGFDYRHWTPFQRVARRLVTSVVRCVADVRITGAHNIPSDGPVVVAANHISMWDSPVLLTMAERRTVMFAADELRRNPWIHLTLHKVWDAIYLKRGEGDTEALEQALAVLRGGGMLGVAPEGHRSVNGLRPGLTGAAYLARRTGAPILPVAIFGQERIPADARRFTRAHVQIRVGEPIPVPYGDPTAQVLQAYTDRVMIEVARMLPPEYRGVYASAVTRNEA